MVTTHQLTNQRVKAIRKVVLEDSNTMKDILDPSSVGFRPHQVLLLSISYATSTVQVPLMVPLATKNSKFSRGSREVHHTSKY